MRIKRDFNQFLCIMLVCVGLTLPALLKCQAGDQKGAHSRKGKGGSDQLKTIPLKTLGGRQFWGDVQFYYGTAPDIETGDTKYWRIQQNVVTNHYRLLDSGDVRLESGTLERCQNKLKSIRDKLKLQPAGGRIVVCIHGILRSSKSFNVLKKQLEKEGYTVCLFDYPSTQVSIDQSANYLKSVLKSLEGFEEIHLVVHSMGGLVVRTYLRENNDKRIKRMVMLGVPNKGAKMADKLKRNLLFQLVLGPSGQQLISTEKGLISSLPTPEFEFGIIAGGRGNTGGFNPLIPGDDDGTVGVYSTRLPGASDFVRVNCLHSFLMLQQGVNEQTVRFLQKGYFREDGKRHPIEQFSPKKTKLK